MKPALDSIDALPEELGSVSTLIADKGCLSEANVGSCEEHQIIPYIAVGRETHNQPFKERFLEPPPVPNDADAITRKRWSSFFRQQLENFKWFVAFVHTASFTFGSVLQYTASGILSLRPWCGRRMLYRSKNFVSSFRAWLIDSNAFRYISSYLTVFQRRSIKTLFFQRPCRQY
jgi:hypothetical protein